jgi:hypothetical protein
LRSLASSTAAPSELMRVYLAMKMEGRSGPRQK